MFRPCTSLNIVQTVSSALGRPQWKQWARKTAWRPYLASLDNVHMLRSNFAEALDERAPSAIPTDDRNVILGLTSRLPSGRIWHRQNDL